MTKKKIRSRTLVILSAISIKKKVTMLINALKSKKTSGSLSNLYINDWIEQNVKIGIDILYFVMT